MTTVVKVNRRNPNYTLYIGRAWAGLPESKWHNPFRIGYHANTREGVLDTYEHHVRNRPDLMDSLHEIDDQVLGCWCHDTPSDGSTLFCHGDVLIKLRKEQLAAGRSDRAMEPDGTQYARCYNGSGASGPIPADRICFSCRGSVDQ